MDKDIVFIPGALVNHKFWHHQASYFQEKARLHYVDVLNGFSITELAKRFAEIAPNKFILIAFSMGGYVALELFHYIPHKIEKLVLINSAAKVISERGQEERKRSLALIKKGKFDFLIRLIFQNSIYDKNKHHLLLPLLQAMAHEVGAEQYVIQLNAILNKFDHSSLLSTIECPTLLLASQQDKIMPIERSEHMALHIKHSKLIYLEECGHVAPLEQPDLLNKLLSDWV
jgi:pimeloyl-ACP methyl ester carboxylesterase